MFASLTPPFTPAASPSLLCPNEVIYQVASDRLAAFNLSVNDRHLLSLKIPQREWEPHPYDYAFSPKGMNDRKNSQ
jgi:hypothetical protein